MQRLLVAHERRCRRTTSASSTMLLMWTWWASCNCRARRSHELLAAPPHTWWCRHLARCPMARGRGKCNRCAEKWLLLDLSSSRTGSVNTMRTSRVVSYMKKRCSNESSELLALRTIRRPSASRSHRCFVRNGVLSLLYTMAIGRCARLIIKPLTSLSSNALPTSTNLEISRASVLSQACAKPARPRNLHHGTTTLLVPKQL